MSTILVLVACVVAAPAEGERIWNGPVRDSERYVTAAPFTYVIGYSDWLADESLMKSLRDSPPDLLHINQPVPINHMLGLTEGFWDWHPKLISREAYAKKVEKAKAYILALRESGVDRIVPYINTSIMLGDHEKRTGFWEMYDLWDRWKWLNVGPKPNRDPVLWCGVKRRSLDPWKPYPEFDLWRYEPSLGDPDWRRFQVRCMEELAACGYDGVFADDCIMASYAPVDQDRFLGYIAARPSRKVLSKHSPLGRPGQGLRFTETVRYWQDTTTEHLEAMLEAGKKSKPDFFVIPNWGSISRPIGLTGRERSGKSLEAWSRVSRVIMLEENYGPGRIVPGAIHDYALQLKQCLAYGVRPAILPYLRGRETGALAHAEMAAGGGGAFIETGAGFPEIRKSYRSLYRNHAEFFAGLRPWSQVALLYDTDEAHFEHDQHIYDGMRTARALLDSHVQFDVILKKDLTVDRLSRYETVILPNVSRLSDDACAVLLSYAERGGNLLATGDIATHDELDRSRPRHGWGLAPWIVRGMTESERTVGKGRVSYVRDMARLLPASPIDMEMLVDIGGDGIETALENIQGQAPSWGERVHAIWARFTSGYARDHLSTQAPAEVRIHVYRGDDGLLIVHMVNYCVSPWEPDDGVPPKPLPTCTVELDVGEAFQPGAIFGLDAVSGRTPVKMTRNGSRITLEISELGYHRMIVLR